MSHVDFVHIHARDFCTIVYPSLTDGTSSQTRANAQDQMLPPVIPSDRIRSDRASPGPVVEATRLPWTFKKPFQWPMAPFQRSMNLRLPKHTSTPDSRLFSSLPPSLSPLRPKAERKTYGTAPRPRQPASPPSGNANAAIPSLSARSVKRQCRTR